MTIDYTIKAIPTVYNGRRYRSRLEARWATFFDLLGWNFEYEPCDFGKWSPDFALWGVRSSKPVYVEIKPIIDWDRDIARKMADAVDGASHTLLLLGQSPNFRPGIGDLGWLGMSDTGSREYFWTEAEFVIDLDHHVDFRPESRLLCPETVLWEIQAEVFHCAPEPVWIRAANRVQWVPK